MDWSNATLSEVLDRWELRRFRVVLFDFDGTLSLLREDWPRIMISQMCAELVRQGSREAPALLHQRVEQTIMGLNGKPTLVQMQWLVEEVQKLSGQAESAQVYRQRYLDELLASVEPRRVAIASGQVSPETWQVPGAGAFLSRLQSMGLKLVLASGSDREAVEFETTLLRLRSYFTDELHAPVQGDPTFSKRGVIERLLQQGFQGSEILGFGDGIVETQEVKRIGGVAIGVASNQENPQQINRWKQQQLLGAGADAIIPCYQ